MLKITVNLYCIKISISIRKWRSIKQFLLKNCLKKSDILKVRILIGQTNREISSSIVTKRYVAVSSKRSTTQKLI